MIGRKSVQTLLEAIGVGPGLADSGAGVNGRVPLGEAEAGCEAASADLTARGIVRSGVAGDRFGFDGCVRVVAYSGWGKLGEEKAVDDCGRSSG